jgi:hypothetical protein
VIEIGFGEGLGFAIRSAAPCWSAIPTTAVMDISLPG